MKIPQSVQLMGHTVEVRVIPASEWRLTTEAVGIYYPDVHEIHIVERGKESEMMHAYYHELTHAMFIMLGYEKLYDDEQLVDSFSGLLHQALTSAKYAPPEEG